MTRLEPVDGTDVYLWKYLPSIPAASTFIVLFTGVTSVLCWRMVRARTWSCIPFFVGGLCTLYFHVSPLYPGPTIQRGDWINLGTSIPYLLIIFPISQFKQSAIVPAYLLTTTPIRSPPTQSKAVSSSWRPCSTPPPSTWCSAVPFAACAASASPSFARVGLPSYSSGETSSR